MRLLGLVGSVSTVGGNLTIKTGDGNDVITSNQATVGGKTTIEPGGGTDTVTP